MAYSEESRYRGSTITSVETSQGLQNYTILKLPIEVPETDQDFYVEIDSSNEFRPDLLSFQAYETPDYGWALMELNNLRSFRDLTLRRRLRVPPLDVIQSAVRDTHDRG
tara:strand:+ start:302 stop:628 length:327 start_codon:yes stop_codon:yes gene_type:complete